MAVDAPVQEVISKALLFDMRRPASFFSDFDADSHALESVAMLSNHKGALIARLVGQSVHISDEDSKTQPAVHLQIDRQWRTLYNSSSTSSWAWHLNTTLISSRSVISGSRLSTHFRPISFSVWIGWPFSGMGHQRKAGGCIILK